MTYQTKTPQIGIVAYLVGLAQSSGKRYAFPSHQTIRKALTERWAWSRCRRTLCYHLEALERDGPLIAAWGAAGRPDFLTCLNLEVSP